MLTKKLWLAHPGRNPAHRWEGRVPAVTLPGGIKIYGPRNPSRWLPHQSKRQAARYARQQERANG